VRRLEGLDGLRGVLALYVMAHHIGPFVAVPAGFSWLPGLVSHGEAAVDVFFILSGLVMVPSVQAFGVRVLPFLVARLGRIYPVFLLALVAAVAVAALPPDYGQMPWLGPLAPDFWPHPPEDAWWAHLAAHLTLLHGLIPQGILPYAGTSFLGSAWSLSTELQFYAVIALLAGWAGRLDVVRLRQLTNGLLLAAVAALAWQEWAPAAWQFSRASLPQAGQYFALGIASVGVVRGQVTAREFFALVLAACVLICLPGGAEKALPPLIWAACLAAELGWAPLEPLQSLLRAPKMRWLGAISYCLYLIHEPVQKLLGIAVADWAAGSGAWFDAVFLPLAVALPIAAAAALHYAVEIPGIALSRAWAERLVAAAEEEPAPLTVGGESASRAAVGWRPAPWLRSGSAASPTDARGRAAGRRRRIARP
jgi:peptidoglycan/LPS O-acetylase OafA/YrhL